MGNPYDRFYEDPLRIIRALRFAVTKGFSLDSLIKESLEEEDLIQKINTLPADRIREEVDRMFRWSTLDTLYIFERFSRIQWIVFNKISLKPTMEKVYIGRTRCRCCGGSVEVQLVENGFCIACRIENGWYIGQS